MIFNKQARITQADFREIDTRIGRWWSRDPIVKPWESPYVTFGDNPIAFMGISNC